MQTKSVLNSSAKKVAAMRGGAVVVEMAFVLPVILLFFFAASEFTRVALMRPTIDTAVYDAARRAMVPGATAADAERVARGVLATVGITNATFSVSTLRVDVPRVTVTIVASVEANTLGPARFFRGRTISRSLTLRREGVRSDSSDDDD
jgi:Flp pilus assembly protein TadG